VGHQGVGEGKGPDRLTEDGRGGNVTERYLLTPVTFFSFFSFFFFFKSYVHCFYGTRNDMHL